MPAYRLRFGCCFSPPLAALPRRFRSEGFRAVIPAAVGMDAARLAQIAARMQGFVDEKQIAGAVTLVARRGCVVHLEAVGYADLESGRRLATDSLFVIASMTKPITATAVMMLQDEGRLSVEDPVAKYLPEFGKVQLASGPPARPITIRDLMTHTSGVGGRTAYRSVVGGNLAGDQQAAVGV